MPRFEFSDNTSHAKQKSSRKRTKLESKGPDLSVFLIQNNTVISSCEKPLKADLGFSGPGARISSSNVKQRKA